MAPVANCPRKFGDERVVSVYACQDASIATDVPRGNIRSCTCSAQLAQDRAAVSEVDRYADGRAAVMQLVWAAAMASDSLSGRARAAKSALDSDYPQLDNLNQLANSPARR